jgi:glycosyltransferase involved in cell wall biosynthesis
MKILVVQDYLRSGGTERQSLLLARGFAAAGHEARLLTFRPGGQLGESGIGVAHHSLQRLDLHLDWFAPGLSRAVREFQPQVVLCMGRMANCYGALLQRAVPSAAVVATLRTGKPLPWLFRRSLRRVRHIVANSVAARDIILQREHSPPEKLSVIYNSLVFPPRPATSDQIGAFRAKHGAGPTTQVLLCVAMFRPEKNHQALIEIAQRLPPTLDWQLWLAGDGPARSSCEQLARRLHLTDRVRFLGWLPDPSLLYQAADVAVLASRRESLSNFLIEAQAAGLPVVASAALGVGEAFAPDASGFLIPPDQPDTFAQALQRLLSDDALHQRMSAHARTYALERFTPEPQIQAYLELFQRLRAAPPPPIAGPKPSAPAQDGSP